MKVLSLALALIGFAIPVLAAYTNDMAAASALAQAKKYSEARAAYQAIAAKETGENKNRALFMAAQYLALTDAEAAMAELQAISTQYALDKWVSLGARKGLPLSRLEPAYGQLVRPRVAALEMASRYLKEGEWAKAKLAVKTLAASENPEILGSLFPTLTSKSIQLFTSKDEQVVFYNDLLRVIPAVEANAKVLGLIKSQLELLK